MAIQSIIVRGIILLFAVWAAWFAAAGYLASDDASYVATARGWLNEFPYVGDSHWSLRQTLVLPMAAAFGLFGVSIESQSVAAAMYYGALLLLCFWWLKSQGHAHTPWLFLVLASVTPGMAGLAGTANVDGAETFFILGSLALFMKARDARPSAANRLLLAAGVMAGLAFLSRATAVALLVAYALMFLRGWYHARPRYVVVGIGAFAVYLFDTLYYLAMTGDPLYRLHTLTATHINGIPQGRGTGNLMEGTVAEPFMAILFNNEFGLTFFLALAVFWLWNKRRDKAATRATADWLSLFLFMALVQFVVVGLLMGLRPLPRYFSFSFIPALMMLSVGLVHFWQQGQRRLASLLVLALAGSGLLLTDLSNREPRFAANALVETMVSNPGSAVYASDDICYRAEGIAIVKYADETRSWACSPRGEADLLLVPAGEAAPHSETFVLEARLSARGTVSGWLIRSVGLDRVLPLPQRLFAANDPVEIYRRVRPVVEE